MLIIYVSASISRARTAAGRMHKWFEAGACGGFLLQMPYHSGSLEETGIWPHPRTATSRFVPRRNILQFKASQNAGRYTMILRQMSIYALKSSGYDQ